MKVEKMFNMYGIGLDHSQDKRLPMKYQTVGHYLFNSFKAGTKAMVLEEMGIDFELENETFIFTIDSNKYKVHGDDMSYRFFRGLDKVVAIKVE